MEEAANEERKKQDEKYVFTQNPKKQLPRAPCVEKMERER